MKSNRNAQKNTPNIRIKGPYSPDETLYLKNLIYSGLQKLADTGKNINYEECCISIATSIPDTIIAPEFSGYWNHWATQFESKKGREIRGKIFDSLIIDLKHKGLLPSDVQGLTGNFSTRINEIINNPTL